MARGPCAPFTSCANTTSVSLDARGGGRHLAELRSERFLHEVQELRPLERSRLRAAMAIVTELWGSPR